MADALSMRDEAMEDGVLAVIIFPQPVWIDEELKQIYVGDSFAQVLMSKAQKGKHVVLMNEILVRKSRIYVGNSTDLKL